MVEEIEKATVITKVWKGWKDYAFQINLFRQICRVVSRKYPTPKGGLHIRRDKKKKTTTTKKKKT